MSLHKVLETFVNEKRKLMDFVLIILNILILLLITIPFLNVVICFLVIIFYSKFTGGIAENLGFQNEFWVRMILKSLLIAVVLLILISLLQPLIVYTTGQAIDLSVVDIIRNNTGAFLASVIVGLAAGFMEEVVFRAFLIKKINSFIKGNLGRFSAILLTSILFGYLHSYQGISGQILSGSIGIMLGVLITINYDRIWPNILVHGFINTLSFTAIYMNWDQLS